MQKISLFWSCMNTSQIMSSINRARICNLNRRVNPLAGAFLSTCTTELHLSPCRRNGYPAATVPREHQFLQLTEAPRMRIQALSPLGVLQQRQFSNQVGGRGEDRSVNIGNDPQGLSGVEFEVTGSLLDARRAGADIPSQGEFLQLSHAFGPDAVAAFAAFSGDDNPIHLDDGYARFGGTRSYDGCLVHGLLVAGLFPAAFGRSIPGSLYVSQSLRFEHPTYVGERVKARIEVEKVRVTRSGKEVFVRCSTVASFDNQKVAVSGTAQVLLPRTCDVRR